MKLKGAAAVPEARPGRVGLFPVGGVVLGDAALELLPAHRFQLALAVGQPALHPEGQALPEAQLLRPRLHQLGAAEDVLGAVLPGEPVGQPGEQLLFGAHRAEVGHEVVVAARGAVGHVFLHKNSFHGLFCCFYYNYERLFSQRKLSAYFCAEKEKTPSGRLLRRGKNLTMADGKQEAIRRAVRAGLGLRLKKALPLGEALAFRIVSCIFLANYMI